MCEYVYKCRWYVCVCVYRDISLCVIGKIYVWKKVFFFLKYKIYILLTVTYVLVKIKLTPLLPTLLHISIPQKYTYRKKKRNILQILIKKKTENSESRITNEVKTF